MGSLQVVLDNHRVADRGNLQAAGRGSPLGVAAGLGTPRPLEEVAAGLGSPLDEEVAAGLGSPLDEEAAAGLGNLPGPGNRRLLAEADRSLQHLAAHTLADKPWKTLFTSLERERILLSPSRRGKASTRPKIGGPRRAATPMAGPSN